jgi:hypothetical protein
MTQYEKGFEDCKKQVKAAMVLAVEEAILMEREACARLCEEVGDKAKDNDGYATGGYACAKEIRARWQK